VYKFGGVAFAVEDVIVVLFVLSFLIQMMRKNHHFTLVRCFKNPTYYVPSKN
jgi:hypothetical protein